MEGDTVLVVEVNCEAVNLLSNIEPINILHLGCEKDQEKESLTSLALYVSILSLSW